MTQASWNHVDHDLTREVLEGKRTDDDSIGKALGFAHECLNADAASDEVTDKMYSLRANAYGLAEFAYGEDDLTKTVTALRFFWGN